MNKEEDQLGNRPRRGLCGRVKKKLMIGKLGIAHELKSKAYDRIALFEGNKMYVHILLIVVN